MIDLRDRLRRTRPYDPLERWGGRIAKPIVVDLIHPTFCILPNPRGTTRDVRFNDVYAGF